MNKRYIIPAYRVKLFSWRYPDVLLATSDPIDPTLSLQEILGPKRVSSVSAAANQLGVVNILRGAATQELFLRISREHLCEECALFLMAMLPLSAEPIIPGVPLDPVFQMKLKEIYRDFIQPGALYEICLPGTLQRQLMCDFDPLVRSRRKKNIWSVTRSSVGGKVFISNLPALPEEATTSTATNPVALPEQRLTQPLTDTGVNFWAGMYHLAEASIWIENILAQQVRQS